MRGDRSRRREESETEMSERGISEATHECERRPQDKTAPEMEEPLK